MQTRRETFKPETEKTRANLIFQELIIRILGEKSHENKVLRSLLQKGLDSKIRRRWETFFKPKTNGASQPHISRVNCSLHQH